MHDSPPAPAPAEGSSPASLDRDIYFQTCLACLATDVRMFNLERYNLGKSYAALVGYQCQPDEGMPDTLCYECARKLNKFKAFRAMSRRAYSILRGLLNEYDEISVSSVREVDRQQNNLGSTLSCCNIVHMEVDPELTITLSEVKCEVEEKKPFDIIKNMLIKPPVLPKADVNNITERINSNNEAKSEYEDHKEPIDYKDSYVSVEPAPKPDDGPEPLLKSVKVKKISTLKSESENKVDKEPAGNCKRVKRIRKLKIEGESQVVKRKRKVKGDAVSKTADGNDGEKPSTPAVKKKYSRRRPGAKQYAIYTPEYYQSIAEVTVMTEEEQIEFFKRREHMPNYKQSPFRCNDCYLGFQHEDGYNTHMLKHDPSKGDKVCKICKIRRKNHNSLVKHICMAHRTKFACRKCDFVCSASEGIRSHSAMHSDTVLSCDACDITFEHLKTYTNHMYVKHPKSVSCTICGRTFFKPLALDNHRAKVHRNFKESSDGGEVPCEQCGVVFRNGEACSVHKRTFPGHDSEDGLITCEYCEKKFAEITTLLKHRKMHRPNLQTNWTTDKLNDGTDKNDRGTDEFGSGITCEQCGEHLPSNREYGYHFRRAHPGETRTQYFKTGKYSRQAIMCERCGKLFWNRTYYHDHMNIHSGIKPYKCDLCNKFFSSALSRTHHRRIHTNVRYECEMCNKQFAALSNFRRHQNTVHTEETPFICDACNKSFKYRSYLVIHMKFVHYNNPRPKRTRTRRKKTDSRDLEGLI